jgi:hypothetical protein
MKRTKTNSI